MSEYIRMNSQPPLKSDLSEHGRYQLLIGYHLSGSVYPDKTLATRSDAKKKQALFEVHNSRVRESRQHDAHDTLSL